MQKPLGDMKKISCSLHLIIRPAFTFIIIFFFSADHFAQQYPFVYYTPKDGLINSRVKGMRQDSKGRLYFITYGGLSVYDGVRFTNYNLQSGLANDLVNDVIEISPDSILVATNVPKLNTLVRGKIGVFPTVDSFYPVTNTFMQSKDGSLYVAADDGLFVYKNKQFIRLPLFDSLGKDIGTNLDDIKEWHHFILLKSWNANMPEKLILYDKEKQTITDIYYGATVLSFSINSRREVWVSFNEGIKMLDSAALAKGQIRFIPASSPYSRSQFRNSFLLFSENQDLWIYRSDQIVKISPSGMVQSIKANQGFNFGGPYNLFIDREGILWIASDGNGVIKLAGMNVIELDELIPGIPFSATCLQQKGDSTWVFNQIDNSFYRIVANQTTSFRLKGEGHLAGIVFFRGKSLYFIEAQNLYLVSDQTQSSSYLDAKPVFTNTNHGTSFGNAIMDRNGAIIINIIQDDLQYYLAVVYQDKIVMHFPLSYSSDQIAMDQQGWLWVPTRDNHLYVLSTHPDQPSLYLQVEYDYAEEIKGFGPRSITIDTMGNIWIGTRYNGIYCLRQNGGEIQVVRQFTIQEGLTDNFIYSMYCDVHNNIWAGTQTGLDKIFLKNGKYVIDNVTKSKNIFRRIYKMINVNENELWAMCYDGSILRITESPQPVPSISPTLLVTSLSVNNVELESTVTSFTHDENNFSIRVAAPSFLDEKSIQYSYQLTGTKSSGWSVPSNTADFNFINLSPGAYHLNIKADFPADFYPPQTLIYNFTIRPPFWSTWWFRFITLAFILGLLYLAIRFYYSRKLEKHRSIMENKQAMEKERTRIATDMHDDLGAGLTRIKFLSEKIGIKKQLNLPIEEEIQNIRSDAHDMIDKMGEIVWALNEKNDSLSDLLAYTRSYAVNYLSENGIKSIVTAPEEFPAIAVSGEFRRNIYLSVKEALHNIIKHSQANKVSITFESSNGLVIGIRDDGIGFDPDHIRPYSNGIINMKKRMTEIGGSMEIKNDQGTLITLSAPLPG